jgi:UDP-GlcNAc:undecaprenyl-phosphate GlcNAc-1-phosphate transferase
LAWRLNLVDRPHSNRFHDRVTPLGGGVAIWIAIVGVFAVGTALVHSTRAPGNASHSVESANEQPRGWQQIGRFIATHTPGMAAQSGKLWVLLALATAMAGLGLWDDVRRIDWRLRIAVQFVIAAVTVGQGWRLALLVEFPFVEAAVSVIWIVAIVNAFNLLDNMDGLSAGVASLAAGLLAIVMLTAPDPETHQPQLFVAGYLAVLVGALVGFLRFNWHPASIFMGDAGSYFVGYLVATSTLMATFAGGDLPDHAILAPLCVLAVPIYDTLSVVAIRLREGRSPFEGDRRHFSHRLAALGLSPRQAVATIYLLTLAAGLGALLLHQVDRIGAAVVGGMVACVLAVIAILETVAQRRSIRP